MTIFTHLGVTLPIVQAPMAGVSTPELAAAVSNAGGLGSVGVGATNAAGARAMILAIRALTDRAFNVNVFVHRASKPDGVRETAWLDEMRPLFAQFNAEPPNEINVIYKSFLEDDEMFAMLVETAPPVVSFHFGVPRSDQIAALKKAGCTLLATATNAREAQESARAGIDVIVAQGFEAGGHRGCFDPDLHDENLTTADLVRVLARAIDVPVIAAGDIMDGADMRTMMDLGAMGVQLGTAFIACPETSADAAYRAALQGEGATQTIMTAAISGRPARSIRNRFSQWGAGARADIPDYPIAYDAGKALNQAAQGMGETGFSAQWAGTGAPRHRAMPAADLVALIYQEFSHADIG